MDAYRWRDDDVVGTHVLHRGAGEFNALRTACGAPAVSGR